MKEFTFVFEIDVLHPPDICTAGALLELVHDMFLQIPVQGVQFQGLQMPDCGLLGSVVDNYGLLISIYLTLNLFQECKHKHFKH